jgi:hypothetical protein
MDFYEYTYMMFSETIDKINIDFIKVLYEEKIDFISAYFKYEPKLGDAYYNKNMSTIIFGLIKLIQYPKELFMIWSDHIDGVYKQYSHNIIIDKNSYGIYYYPYTYDNSPIKLYNMSPEYLPIQPDKSFDDKNIIGDYWYNKTLNNHIAIDIAIEKCSSLTKNDWFNKRLNHLTASDIKVDEVDKEDSNVKTRLYYLTTNDKEIKLIN